MVGNNEDFFSNQWFRLLARAILHEMNVDSDG